MPKIKSNLKKTRDAHVDKFIEFMDFFNKFIGHKKRIRREFIEKKMLI